MRYLLLLLLLIFWPSFSQAQFLSEINSGLSLVQNEPFPEPQQEVTISLSDFTIGKNINTISWKINGTTQSDLNNQRVINTTAPEIGQTTSVIANVVFSDGQSSEVKQDITSGYLDLIIEPQTRTPAFYLGRALPSSSSIVNVSAVLNGNVLNPTKMVYRWIFDGKVQNNGPQPGKNKTSYQIPRFAKDSLISVEISNSYGKVLAKKTTRIELTSPFISFYEISPLYGQQTKALLNSHQMTDGSIALKAEPYYLDLQTYNSPSELSWSVAGEEVAGTAENPYELILTKEGSGSAGVKFSVRNLELLLQGAERQITINY